MNSGHCQEEQEQLRLLKDLCETLAASLKALSNSTPTTRLIEFIVYSSNSILYSADSYTYLRESGRVVGSKLLIRGMVESYIAAAAVTKDRSLLFRKLYSELLDYAKMFKAEANFDTQLAKHKTDLIDAFLREDPSFSIVERKIKIEELATVANLTDLYNILFRSYCQFTHHTLHAAKGAFDEATDRLDTWFCCYVTICILDLLKTQTPAVVPDLQPLRQRMNQFEQFHLG